MTGALDLTQYKVVDFYTKRVLRLSNTQELSDWLWNNTATKSDGLRDTIDGLVSALESGEEYKYHALANELEITPKKTRRKTK